MTSSECMARDNASKAMLEELQRVGLLDSHVCHVERRAINVFTNNKGSVNVDFAVQSGKIIKICMYIHRDGLGSSIQTSLESVGKKYKCWGIEVGNQGVPRNDEGVLYKLNTRVNWTNMAPEEVASIANTVKDFVRDVSRVLN